MPDKEDEFTKGFNKRYDAQKEKDDKLFTKGFNAGYLLNQHEPELLNSVLKSPTENELFLEGMKSGKKQHEKDKVLQEIKQAYLSKDRERDKD